MPLDCRNPCPPHALRQSSIPAAVTPVHMLFRAELVAWNCLSVSASPLARTMGGSPAASGNGGILVSVAGGGLGARGELPYSVQMLAWPCPAAQRGYVAQRGGLARERRGISSSTPACDPWGCFPPLFEVAGASFVPFNRVGALRTGEKVIGMGDQHVQNEAQRARNTYGMRQKDNSGLGYKIPLPTLSHGTIMPLIRQ